MLYKSYAKLNIGLDITGVREDGYHLIDTVMQMIDYYDEMDISLRDDDEVVIECDDMNVPTDKSTLVYRAVKCMTDRGVTVKVNKRVPMEAGMGGASSNAATILMALNEMLSMGKTEEELEKIAVTLGADVPFFIRGGRQRCMGIGEKMRPLTPRVEYYVVKKPGVGISTKDVYDGYDRMKPVLSGDVINVLEPVTAEKFPVINDIKKELLANGARTASMTGSGTAVFGIFDDRKKAQWCADKIGGIVCQTC